MAASTVRQPPARGGLLRIFRETAMRPQRFLPGLTLLLFAAPLPAQQALTLTLQSRLPKGDTYETVLVPVQWLPAQTALIVCDMWDHHHCPTAERRVGEIAPRMNEVIDAARRRGVLVIHAPSS